MADPRGLDPGTLPSTAFYNKKCTDIYVSYGSGSGTLPGTVLYKKVDRNMYLYGTYRGQQILASESG
jgi:hypothetical protein